MRADTIARHLKLAADAVPHERRGSLDGHRRSSDVADDHTDAVFLAIQLHQACHHDAVPARTTSNGSSALNSTACMGKQRKKTVWSVEHGHIKVTASLTKLLMHDVVMYQGI